MNKTIVILIVLVSSMSAEQKWKLSLKSPKNLFSYQLTSYTVSSDGKTIASLYTSKEVAKEGDIRKQFIEIGTMTKNWWLGNDQWFNVDKIGFIDNTHLLILYSTFTLSISSLVDLKTKKQTIFFGIAEYIKEGKNKGLFLVHDTKSYFPAPEYGAFWYDELRNKKGELVKVLSKPKNESGCIPLKTILDREGNYPSLRQNMDDCVYVDM